MIYPFPSGQNRGEHFFHRREHFFHLSGNISSTAGEHFFHRKTLRALIFLVFSCPNYQLSSKVITKYNNNSTNRDRWKKIILLHFSFFPDIMTRERGFSNGRWKENKGATGFLCGEVQ